MVYKSHMKNKTVNYSLLITHDLVHYSYPNNQNHSYVI